jgi:hypothetical protein
MTGSDRYNAANPVRATTAASDLLRLVRCGKARMRTRQRPRAVHWALFQKDKKKPALGGLGLRCSRLLWLAPEISSGPVEKLLK